MKRSWFLLWNTRKTEPARAANHRGVPRTLAARDVPFALLRRSLAQRSLAGGWMHEFLSVPVGRRAALCELLTLLAVSCGKKEEPAGPVKEYRLTGVVVSYDADRKVALIRHEKIEGLMEAMTMEFPVRDERAASKLVPGQRITARLFQRESDYEYWISGIETAAAR